MSKDNGFVINKTNEIPQIDLDIFLTIPNNLLLLHMILSTYKGTSQKVTLSDLL